MKAIFEHDIFNDEVDGPGKISDHIQAGLLVINAAHDHLVYPDPAIALAEAMGVETLVVDENYGHRAFFGGQCAVEEVNQTFSRFLENGR